MSFRLCEVANYLRATLCRHGVSALAHSPTRGDLNAAESRGLAFSFRGGVGSQIGLASWHWQRDKWILTALPAVLLSLVHQSVSKKRSFHSLRRWDLSAERENGAVKDQRRELWIGLLLQPQRRAISRLTYTVTWIVKGLWLQRHHQCRPVVLSWIRPRLSLGGTLSLSQAGLDAWVCSLGTL